MLLGACRVRRECLARVVCVMRHVRIVASDVPVVLAEAEERLGESPAVRMRARVVGDGAHRAGRERLIAVVANLKPDGDQRHCDKDSGPPGSALAPSHCRRWTARTVACAASRSSARVTKVSTPMSTRLSFHADIQSAGGMAYTSPAAANGTSTRAGARARYPFDMPMLVVPAKSKEARALLRAGLTPFSESDGQLQFDAPQEPFRLRFLELRKRERGFNRRGIWTLVAAAVVMLAAIITFSATDPPCDAQPCPAPALGVGAWLVVLAAVAIPAAIWCFAVGMRADREASRLEAPGGLAPGQGRDQPCHRGRGGKDGSETSRRALGASSGLVSSSRCTRARHHSRRRRAPPS